MCLQTGAVNCDLKLVRLHRLCRPKGIKGFTPVGPRPTESVLSPQGYANRELLANFAGKPVQNPGQTLKGGTKAKMEIWVVNLGEAFNVRRRGGYTSAF